jgi:hypothetical protein
MNNPTLHFQLPGDMGVFQSVAQMRSLVNKSFWHPWIRERAALLITRCNRDKKCEEQTLSGWVHNIIQYVGDPAGLEALHDPISFYEARIRQDKTVWGDCDDMSIYLAALLKSIGHSPKFRVIGRGKDFTHVHILCHDNKLDPSMELGNLPRNPSRAIQIII